MPRLIVLAVLGCCQVRFAFTVRLAQAEAVLLLQHMQLRLCLCRPLVQSSEGIDRVGHTVQAFIVHVGDNGLGLRVDGGELVGGGWPAG